MSTSLPCPDEAALCPGQAKTVSERSLLASHQKTWTLPAAPLGHSNQTWSRRIGHSNSVEKRGWFNVGSALAITLALFAAPLRAQFAYVANNDSGNISGYTINPATGALTPIAGSPFAAGSTPGAVTVDPNGKFAYVANQGGINVSGYTINRATGALTPIAGSPFGAGSFPTSVTVDPSGKFAYVANNRDNTVSGYGINPTTGALKPIAGSPFAAGTGPISVAVARVKPRAVYTANAGANTLLWILRQHDLGNEKNSAEECATHAVSKLETMKRILSVVTPVCRSRPPSHLVPRYPKPKGITHSPRTSHSLFPQHRFAN